MKNSLIIVLVVVVAVVASLGGYLVSSQAPTATTTPTTTATTTATATATTTTPASRQLKLGLVLSGDETDLGWDKALVDAAEWAKVKYDVEVSYSNFVGYGDYPRVVRDYALGGYDLVWTHSGGYVEGTYEVAQDFPDVNFVSFNSWMPPPTPNSIGIWMGNFGGDYLCGVLAAHMTETGNVAYIEGENYLALYFDARAFELGVKSVNPDITVHATALGTWVDTVLAHSVTTSLVQNNSVDIIAVNAGVAGRGAFSAAEEQGILAMGSYADAAALAPNTVVTSFLMDLPDTMGWIVNTIQEDEWDQYGGKWLEIPYIDLAPFRAFDGQISEAVKDELEQVRQGLIDGEIPFLPPDAMELYPTVDYFIPPEVS